MEIEKRWFADFTPREIEKIRQRRETVVVVDLWAATTNLVLMVAKKPARVIVVNDQRYPQAARTYTGAILIGESRKTLQEKFVSSNDPMEIERVDI